METVTSLQKANTKTDIAVITEDNKVTITKQNILVHWNDEPILDVDSNNLGLVRDRNPDAGWNELRRVKIVGNTHVSFTELTPELRQVLLEDLAYAYGMETNKFSNKLVEFRFI